MEVNTISNHSNKLPVHGRIQCAKCFPPGKNEIKVDNWRIKNDPGAWGSTNPELLILGFSKGATQSDIYENGQFDEVAFGGKQTRSNLTQILRSVKLLEDTEKIDEKINNNEKKFAFGSLVRCSLSRLNPKTGTHQTSGQLINKSFNEIPHIIDNCSDQFLQHLPTRLKYILMLGTSDSYIKNCQKIMRKLYPDNFHVINEVAYSNGLLTWVHLTHPSKGNGTLKQWLYSGKDSKPGYKRELALSVLR